MKIAFLSFYSGMNMRGVERWVLELASLLSKNNQITVFQNKEFDIETKYKIIAVDIKYRDRVGSWLTKHLFIDYKSLKTFEFNLKILKRLIREDYDIYIPTDGGWEPAIVRIVSWLKRKKMVIVGHAGIGFDDANNLWSFPDVFVVLSSYAQKWAKKVNPFVKTVLIPDAVDLDKFTINGKRIDLGFNNKFPVALCVGALEKGKRIDLVIKAVSKVNNLNLLVCGKGKLMRELSDLGNKVLRERFKMRSFDFDEMPKVYRSCDVFVSASLPSYSFEMVIVEALACGLPVVANDDPIRREIVGDAGLFTDVNNSGGFAIEIKKAIKNDWGDLPRKQATKFSWDAIFEKYEKLINSLII